MGIDFIRNAWNERAVLVNSLPLLGQFNEVPSYLQPIKDQCLVTSLNQDFDRFQASIKLAIRR